MQKLITKNNIDSYVFSYTGKHIESETFGGLYENELIELLYRLKDSYDIVQVLQVEKNDDGSVNYIIILNEKA